VTAHEHVALQLARAFPEQLQLAPLLAAKAFRAAVDEALQVMTADEIVIGVLTRGNLSGARNAYGVIIDRIKGLPEARRLAAQVIESDEERRRFARLGFAARRGEELARLVIDGRLFEDEAERQLTTEFDEEPVRETALDALRGRLQ